jgi:hypothetical protein
MKRGMIVAINALLVVVIVLIILATWLPAIYTSQWFQGNHWIRMHLLHNEDANGKAIKESSN